MAVEDTDVVDFVSTHPGGDSVQLTITDHLDWSNGEAHARVLQKKIYRYLDFVESGELYEQYANARAVRTIVICVRAKYPPSAYAKRFI